MNTNINEELYWNMPEYNNVDLPDPVVEVVFKFRSQEDYEKFHALVKEHVYEGKRVFDGMQRKERKSAWYPLLEKPSNYKYE
jgi:hypothetical protein